MTYDPDGAVPRKLPPGRHGLPRQFVLHNQRERLVDAAVHVFGTRSFGEARVADVLERAAISRKTFYEQFDDKEACFIAAYEAAAERARDAVRAAARDADDWDDAVRAGVAALLNFLADEPELARLLAVEVAGAGPTALRRRSEAARGFAAMLAQVERRRADAGRRGDDRRHLGGRPRARARRPLHTSCRSCATSSPTAPSSSSAARARSPRPPGRPAAR